MKSLITSRHRSICQIMLRVARPVAMLCAVVPMFFVVPAFADDNADVSKLMKSGQFADALVKADAALVQHPRDPQLLFLKGLILTEQNKTTEAIAVFVKLTEEFPQLPEPYNNLAVLFASNGQYDKARASLEMAIRTNPTYATAHENLGDVYAKLASQAYDKALQLDSNNSGAKSKLTLVRTLVGNPTGNVAPKAIAGATKSVVTAAASVQQEPAKIEAKLDAKAVAKVEPKASAKAVVKVDADSDHDDVLKAVNAWASAWSAKDMKAYLGAYGSAFQTPDGVSRTKWADERRSRIEGKGHIHVQVESPQVTMNGNTASVRFRQIYASDRLTANSKKTLVLEKQGSKWQIKQERTGN